VERGRIQDYVVEGARHLSCRKSATRKSLPCAGALKKPTPGTRSIAEAADFIELSQSKKTDAQRDFPIWECCARLEEIFVRNSFTGRAPVFILNRFNKISDGIACLAVSFPSWPIFSDKWESQRCTNCSARKESRS
jgi:hypothetical protein